MYGATWCKPNRKQNYFPAIKQQTVRRLVIKLSTRCRESREWKEVEIRLAIDWQIKLTGNSDQVKLFYLSQCYDRPVAQFMPECHNVHIWQINLNGSSDWVKLFYISPCYDMPVPQCMLKCHSVHIWQINLTGSSDRVKLFYIRLTSDNVTHIISVDMSDRTRGYFQIHSSRYLQIHNKWYLQIHTRGYLQIHLRIYLQIHGMISKYTG